MESLSLVHDSQLLFQNLLHYESGADAAKLQEAYQLTVRGHSSVKRASGDPYFIHPLHVAKLLVDKRMDSDTVIAGLLHDIVEDTPASLDYIREKFGNSVADLVDGVTKIKLSEQKMIDWLQQHPRGEKKSLQFNNFRKLLNSSLDEPRVLIIKLADRVHNMETLSSIQIKSKRRRISKETLDIYVPIARRLGIENWKNIMSEHAFRELQPDAYSRIKKMLQQQLGKDQAKIERISSLLQSKLIALGAPAHIQVIGRHKDIYSIWQKMQEDKVDDIKDIGDIIGCRILCENIDECYFILGLLHTSYRHKPTTFKDYVSVPKSNGYRSLHSSIFAYDFLIEVQIRTQLMQEINDFGPAAHWRYKETSGSDYSPLHGITEILNESSITRPTDLLDRTKLAMKNDEIQVFTPKGEIINLQQGSTVLDFAFAVHSDIGLSCDKTKVNGRTTTIATEVHNGDVIEIFTSSKAQPTTSWLTFAHTPRAKSYIQRFLNQKVRQNQYEASQKLMESLAKKHKISHKELDVALPYVAKKIGATSVEQLYELIGKRKVAHHIIMHHIRNFLELPHIPVKDKSQGMAVIPCKSCRPLPGDKILGYLHPEFGIIAHLPSCRINKLYKNLPSINRTWKKTDGKLYPIVLDITIQNLIGVMAKCSSTISEHHINIQSVNFQSHHKKNNDILQNFTVSIDVNNVKKLDKLIAHLESLEHVYSVKRI